MHGPTASERLRRSLWTAIAEDDWAQADLDAAVSEYVREAREREVPLVEICRSLRVHVQQVGLGLSPDRYETVARHVTALAETAHRGEFRGRHTSHTVNVPGAGEESG
jgi:predicted alpha/beta hydrolase